MLIEQLNTMQVLLEARSERRGEKKQLQALEDYEKRLTELLSKWQALIVVASRLGYDHNIVATMRDTALAADQRFKTSMTLTPSDLRLLNTQVDALRQDVQARWNIYRDDLISDTLQAQIQIVLIIGLPRTRERLSQLNVYLIRLRDLELPSSAELSRLTDLIEEIEQTVAESLPEMAPEVAAFLERLSTRTARLTDVTPVVVQWCQKHGLLDRITLHFERN